MYQTTVKLMYQTAAKIIFRVAKYAPSQCQIVLTPLLDSLKKVKVLILLSSLFTLLLGCNSQSLQTREATLVKPTNGFSIAVAGDWDDYWDGIISGNGKSHTLESMKEAGKSDLVVLIGDLSYGRDGLPPKEQAIRWCDNAKTVSNHTPMIFVPGDHDSNRQDGDIKTYSKCLTPTGNNTIISEPKTNGYGMYPYLYYVDVTVGDAKMRIVGTSIAFQEEESEPKQAQKYFKKYEKGSKNYAWLKSVYQSAKDENMWLIHFNHLPCIDMGKNQSFGQGCEDVLNLNIEQGVNIFFSGSSHNIWRTHLLSHWSECPLLPLTTRSDGANPNCVLDPETSTFEHGSGMVQAHAGAGGKVSASKRAVPCDPINDGEAAHYLAPNTCVADDVPGFVQLTVTENELRAEYFLSQTNDYFIPYAFKFIKKATQK